MLASHVPGESEGNSLTHSLAIYYYYNTHWGKIGVNTHTKALQLTLIVKF